MHNGELSYFLFSPPFFPRQGVRLTEQQLQGVAKRALHYILAREKDLGALPGANGRDTKLDNLAEAKAATETAPAHTRITVAPTLSTPSIVQATAPTLANG